MKIVNYYKKPNKMSMAVDIPIYRENGIPKTVRLHQIKFVVDHAAGEYFAIGLDCEEAFIVVRKAANWHLYKDLPEYPYFKQKYEAELAHRQNVAELVKHINANKL